jgi:uncharacterized OB-fold protein
MKMQKFLDCIRKGEFKVYVCSSCKKKIWPPFQYCPECLSKANLEDIEKIGILLEFTISYVKNMEGIFGIVDISGIRLLGSIFGHPLRCGMKVKMIRCGISSDDISLFYHFEIQNNNNDKS